MKKDIDWFIQEGLLVKTSFIQKLAPRFIQKAKNNLITLSILFDLHKNKGARNSLNVPDDYDSNEWVVICAYYAMYIAASAALAKISYKSKNHTATVLALETFFVKKQLLEEDYLKMIEKAQLEKEYIDNLNLARDKRERLHNTVLQKKRQEELQKR